VPTRYPWEKGQPRPVLLLVVLVLVLVLILVRSSWAPYPWLALRSLFRCRIALLTQPGSTHMQHPLVMRGAEVEGWLPLNLM
jgi:hypothetical protein